MTLERLRIFVAVAERQHVTAAARALNLTQSAVSNAIAALEAEHDVHLFDRVGRGVVLNQTGQAIEGIAIIMAVYLTISLSISLFMNWYNARIALRER